MLKWIEARIVKDAMRSAELFATHPIRTTVATCAFAVFAMGLYLHQGAMVGYEYGRSKGLDRYFD